MVPVHIISFGYDPITNQSIKTDILKPKIPPNHRLQQHRYSTNVIRVNRDLDR